MQAKILDASAGAWNSQVEQLTKRLPAEQRMSAFPLYFLQSTLPRIGGKIVVYQDEQTIVGFALLFPRLIQPNGNACYTLRLYPFSAPTGSATTGSATTGIDPAQWIDLTNQQLAPASVVYDTPEAPFDYAQTHTLMGRVDVGRPSQTEAAQIPTLQQQIWGATEDESYPADLHRVTFAPGSSLVARVEGELAGFLLGFYKFGGYTLPADWHTRFNGHFRLESQIMGVLPQFRGLRIANLLKQQQAVDAITQQIGVVNWTADPLQFVNATLNFSSLHAVCFDFLPNLYSFRNELNRITASRLGLTWLVQSDQVQERLTQGERSPVMDLATHPEIPQANQGYAEVSFELDTPTLAIEIPIDWNKTQRDHFEEAVRWRQATDALFAHYVGKEAGKYTITKVAELGTRRFLIAEQSCTALWHRLGRSSLFPE